MAGWTVVDIDFSGGNSVRDEVVADIDMPSVLATGPSAIFLQENGALVVLVDCQRRGVISLCIKEVLGPEDHWHHIVYAHQFAFR